MSSKWIVKDNYVMIEREGQLPLLHSIMLDRERMLSYSYWDYEAWMISKYVNNRVLLLGLGGATSLQILDNLGITPNEVTGIDIDADELNEKGVLNYSYLTIVNSDAYSYLTATKDMYDLIIVDLYDFNGYVEDVYKNVSLLKSKLNFNGLLAFHCLDPMIKYYTFNIKFKHRCPSTSYEIAYNADKCFGRMYILPLWTSSLVIATDTELNLISNDSLDSKDKSPLYMWMDKFFRTRLIEFDVLKNNFTRFEKHLEYGNIEEIDKLQLTNLYASLKDQNFIKTFHKVFGQIDEKDLEGKSSTVDVDDKNVYCFFLLCEFMIIKDDKALASRVVDILEQLGELNIEISKIVRSFIFAYDKQWYKALEEIG